MEHLAYYHVGCEPASGMGRPTVWARRLLRKLLLPASRRLVQILTSVVDRLDKDERDILLLQAEVESLHRRQDDVAERFPTTVAFGWDYVAMVRRLAVLEDHVAELLAARDDAAGAPTPDDASTTLARAS